MKEEEREDEAIIPEEDFREAIAACCEDPLLKRYFQLAPTGAKLFIGLGFYSTHFGDKVDPRQYAECQAEIEPALTIVDLKYLIRFEEDRNTKRYLKGLLAQREAEEGDETATPAETEAPPGSKPADDIPPVPRRRLRRRNAVAGLQWALRKDRVRLLTFLARAAVLAVLLAGGAVFLYLNRDRINIDFGRPNTASPEPAPVAKVQTSEVPPERTEPEPVKEKVDAPEQQPTVVADAAETNAPSAQIASDAVPTSTAVVVKAETSLKEGPLTADTNDVVVTVDIAPGDTAEPERVRPTRWPRVVFTDGRKIVRHPGGKIEVPRRFSCLGAGIKPFWVYGPHPEVEAEKERKARLEWRSLAEQAKSMSIER